MLIVSDGIYVGCELHSKSHAIAESVILAILLPLSQQSCDLFCRFGKHIMLVKFHQKAVDCLRTHRAIEHDFIGRAARQMRQSAPRTAIALRRPVLLCLRLVRSLEGHLRISRGCLLSIYDAVQPRVGKQVNSSMISSYRINGFRSISARLQWLDFSYSASSDGRFAAKQRTVQLSHIRNIRKLRD